METTTNTTNESTNPTANEVNAEPTVQQQRFIQLRAQGWTYARLTDIPAPELHPIAHDWTP